MFAPICFLILPIYVTTPLLTIPPSQKIHAFPLITNLLSLPIYSYTNNIAQITTHLYNPHPQISRVKAPPTPQHKHTNPSTKYPKNGKTSYHNPNLQYPPLPRASQTYSPLNTPIQSYYIDGSFTPLDNPWTNPRMVVWQTS